MISRAELEFGKMGYLKFENKDIIVYYKPYMREDIRVDDITFCKRTKKIIFYQGSPYGSDAYSMDYQLIKAIDLQRAELGWAYELYENERDN